MSITIQNLTMEDPRLGEQKINKVFLGEQLVYDRIRRIPFLKTTNNGSDSKLWYKNNSETSTQFFAKTANLEIVNQIFLEPRESFINLDLSSNTSEVIFFFEDKNNGRGITEITTRDENITGFLLQDLINLEKLWFYNSNLEFIDISKNSRLQSFLCNTGKLSSIDISENKELVSFGLVNSSLGSLDLLANTKLTNLYLYSNQLETLDLSYTTQLTLLNLMNNNFSELDVSKNINITSLTCSQNQLQTIDVSNNIALEELHCNLNQLTEIDISANISLQKLDCSENNLSTVDLSKNNKLERVKIDNNTLTSFDISGCPLLEVCNCNINQISTLDISQNKKLTSLFCNENQLTPEVLDDILIQLDAHGLSNGTFEYMKNASPTHLSYDAYSNLLNKGWRLEGHIPPSDLDH